MLLFKGNGRNVHVQTKGVYVWYVIYFTSLLYHGIIDRATFHNEFNMIVTITGRMSKKPYSHNIMGIRFRLSAYFFNKRASSSFNFSSNTRQASSIGSEVVISTPAFFNTSIG